jgi:cell division cycle 14
MQTTGDLSWIVPNTIIAFPSPVTPGYGRVTAANNCQPRDLLNGFKEANVGGVIRLNEKLYDSRTFERENISVHSLEFPDGSNPSDSVIGRFV